MNPYRIDLDITINRPVAEVFSAWSSAQALAQWFAPMAIERPNVDMDFSVGGHYVIRMRVADDVTFTTSGRFLEISPDQKIVMTWRCDAFPDPETTVTIRFTEAGAGTVVHVVHEQFENDETCTNHSHGWDACLSELQAQLHRA